MSDRVPNDDNADAIIKTISLSRYFPEGDVHALRDVSLEIPRQSHVAIVGKSGSGKSTLLNLIGGMDQPSSGSIQFNGQPLKSLNLDRYRCDQIGFVFQRYYLLPNLTAVENVQIPMFETTLNASERIEKARQLLSQVGLSGRERHLPRQLSGGECQRVAIARAIANDPKLILADEPTGALDSDTGSQILTLLESLQQSNQTALVVVTHDDVIAGRAGSQIELKDGEIADIR
ncbi:ABC transporter ATP-binding protein [Stieleria sp. JC731]|uniref:ABC transporter ATP-binding protein n=1 Tax=Pirellulaceae TaxID=2691357 RepID=UPI001E4F7C52|nr:ABC transporter ATP-binding protein [Stieleria sp. JC731]MCC9602663.1 ABC transporter ATP-binding protein [Stieleria sp. JC731]